MATVNSFDMKYADILKTIMAASPETNQRTGKRVRAVHGVVLSGRVHDAGSPFPILSLRDIKPMWSCAEVVWFLSGSKDPKWMEHFGFKTWSKFTDLDGLVSSATGWRWRHAFGVDQLARLVARLRDDVSFRQGVLQSWDPRVDAVSPGPNAPCLTTWHMHVIDGRLHLSILQRSADMYFGFPHDILGARIVQEFVAAAVGVHVGSIMYAISNAHLYEDQWEAAEEMMLRTRTALDFADPVRDLNILEFDYQRALKGDMTLPLELMQKISRFYKPFPAIAGPSIAV